MTISSIFAALAAAFSHVQIDAPAAVARLQQVQEGLETASAVVSVLPDSPAKSEATAALNKAAAVAGEAIVAAHTVESAMAHTVESAMAHTVAGA